MWLDIAIRVWLFFYTAILVLAVFCLILKAISFFTFLKYPKWLSFLKIKVRWFLLIIVVMIGLAHQMGFVFHRFIDEENPVLHDVNVLTGKWVKGRNVLQLNSDGSATFSGRAKISEDNKVSNLKLRWKYEYDSGLYIIAQEGYKLDNLHLIKAAGEYRLLEFQENLTNFGYSKEKD